MAINNPSTLYSAGNVVLDSTPYMRIAAQERMRKEARDQALNQYYQKLPDTVNDKGTRDQEIPVLNQIKGDLMEFGIKNRNALINPNIDGGAAQLAFQQKMRNYSAVTRKSQAAGLVDHQAGQLYFNPKNQDLLNSDYFIQSHDRHNLPVTDPNFKMLDLADVTANRPFDGKSFTTEIKKQFPYSEGIPIVSPHPTDKTLETVTTNPQLNEPTKLNMYAYATEKYHNDKAFQRKIDNDINSDQELAQLNEVSQRIFGHEIRTPEDKAAAFTAAQLPTTGVRTSVRGSIEMANKARQDAATLAFERRKSLMAFNDRLIKGRKTDGTVDISQIGYPIEQLDKDFGVNIPNAESTITGEKLGNKRVIYTSNIDPSIYALINPTDENKAIYPVQPAQIKQNDGTFKPGFYVEDGDLVGKEKKRISGEKVRNAFIKETVPTKFKLQTVTNKPTTETKSTKTVSPSTIKGLVGKKGYEGYTEKEIMDYYKSNGYEIK